MDKKSLKNDKILINSKGKREKQVQKLGVLGEFDKKSAIIYVIHVLCKCVKVGYSI